MTRQEYEQKKRECWEEYRKPRKAYRHGDAAEMVHYDAFSYAFDRAYALGKQETKQESDAGTVIQGWISRDKYVDREVFTSDLFLSTQRPIRSKERKGWTDMGMYIPLDSNLFSDITWDSDPEQVEIIIKRKKNG